MDSNISSTQLTTWLRCPKQYEFRYIQGFRLPPRASLTRGSSCHKAWETEHRHKMATKEDLSIEQVLDVYNDEFEKRAVETVWDDEDKGKVKDSGVKMTKVYYENVSTKVQPIACEESFKIELCGHEVTGVIDLETDKGEIRDAKTSSRKKSSIPVDHQLQMAFYAEARPSARRFVLDNAIATSKNAELESLTLTREDLPKQRLENYLSAFGESLMKGNFPPTAPDNWCCSEKWCGYWNQCPFGSGGRIS